MQWNLGHASPLSPHLTRYAPPQSHPQLASFPMQFTAPNAMLDSIIISRRRVLPQAWCCLFGVAQTHPALQKFFLDFDSLAGPPPSKYARRSTRNKYANVVHLWKVEKRLVSKSKLRSRVVRRRKTAKTQEIRADAHKIKRPV